MLLVNVAALIEVAKCALTSFHCLAVAHYGRFCCGKRRDEMAVLLDSIISCFNEYEYYGE
jgi:hypothetical protein